MSSRAALFVHPVFANRAHYRRVCTLGRPQRERGAKSVLERDANEREINEEIERVRSCFLCSFFSFERARELCLLLTRKSDFWEPSLSSTIRSSFG